MRRTTQTITRRPRRRLGRTLLLAAVGLIGGAQQLQAAMPKARCHVPAFIDSGDSVTPNVMILIDNSGSMAWPTYSIGMFDPSVTYYGYWEADRCYRIQSNTWKPDTSRLADPGNECNYSGTYTWSGNFLNWAYMTRMEVMKRALIGGVKVSNGARILFENAAYAYDIWRGDYWWYCAPNGSFWSRYTPIPTNRRGIRLARIGDQFVAVGYRNCFGGSSSAVLNWQRVSSGIATVQPPKGVLDEVEQNARWALATFDNGNGGRLEHYYGFNQNNSTGPSIFNRIEGLSAGGSTPLAESVYEMVRYHQQVRPYYRSNHYQRGIGSNRDPWYEWEGAKAMIPCRESFLLVISDGSPTADYSFPSDLDQVNTGTQPLDFDGDGNEPRIRTPVPNWPPTGIPWTFLQPDRWTPDYLDDIALWAHTTDLRDDIAGVQGITSYYLFAFGDIQGSERSAPFVMWNAAINGAFVDKNGNNRPDGPEEWDEDGDNIPDAFFLAQEGNELENQLRALLSAVLNRAASGTKAAVAPQQGLGQRGGTFGAQAYFKPQIDDGLGGEATWAGFLRGFWFDRFFNIRDNGSDPDELDLKDDRIAVYEFVTDQTRLDALLGSKTVPVENGHTVVKLYWDLTDPMSSTEQPDGTIGAFDEAVLIEDFMSAFEAGALLFKQDPAKRTIYTNLGIDTKPKSKGGAVQRADFDVANAGILQPYLSSVDPPYTPDLAETLDLIEYIRGWDKPGRGWRSRTMTIDGVTNTWKLGDIMNSSPVLQSPPKASSIIGQIDPTWTDSYVKEHGERPYVMYVGANDGMLHAYYVGGVTTIFDKSNPHAVARLKFDTHKTYTWQGQAYRPGEEVWAFVPHVLLPHLHWLTENDYCHTYYVDGTPFIAPVRGFAPDALHPDGWGDLLIGGLRLGCSPVDMGGGTVYYPSVFVLDITNPFDPQPLFEWFDPTGDGGYTTSAPRPFGSSVVKGGSWPDDFCFWVTWGSGPQDYGFTKGAAPANLYWNSLNAALGSKTTTCRDAKIPVPRFAGQYVEEIIATPLAGDVFNELNGQTFGLFQGDVIYYPTMTLHDPFGPTYDFRGRILRLDPMPKSGSSADGEYASPDPNDWVLDELTRLDVPFTTSLAFRQINGVFESSGGLQHLRLDLFSGTGRFYNLEDAGYGDQQYLLKISDDCWYKERTASPCKSAAYGFHDFGGPSDTSDRFQYLENCELDIQANGLLASGCTVDGKSVATYGDFEALNTAARTASPYRDDWIIPLQTRERLVFDPVISGGRTAIYSTYTVNQGQLCSAAAGSGGLYFVDVNGLTLLKYTAGDGQAQVQCVGDNCEKVVVTDEKGQVEVVENPFISKPIKGLESLLRPFNLFR